MNRKEWYKQRRLYRIKRLVYQAYGDDAPTNVYLAYEKFDDIIKQSAGYGRLDTHGYNMPEIFQVITRVRQEWPTRMDQYKNTVRRCMKRNAMMARITQCSCTPSYYFNA